MLDINKYSQGNPALGGTKRDTVCIDTNRVLDSCRDKDCYEDTRVFLTEIGQEIVEHSTSLRVKCTEIVATHIAVDNIQFNRGFYQVSIKVYTKLVIECCTVLGKPQEIEGICITEKQVILYGGEGGARTFRSNPIDDNFCTNRHGIEESSTSPTAVLEIIDPIVLSICVKEKCQCKPGPHPIHQPCGIDNLPDSIMPNIGAPLFDHPNIVRQLFVTMGFFSIIRLVRPGQFLVSATDYCIPDKVCSPSGVVDPCSAFEKMPFPSCEFCPGSTAYPATSIPGVISGSSCSDCKK